MAVSEKIALRHDLWNRRILQIIREDPHASRMTVKKMSGLSMESTLSQIDELLRDGLIETVGKENAIGAGRRATLLRIRAEGAYFAGLRFSAGGVTAVVMDFLHRRVCESSSEFTSPPNGDEMMNAIRAALDDVLTAMGDKRQRVRGIGIGAPGLIDPEAGVITRYVHIPDWRNVPLRDIISREYGLPVYLEHGVKCTARAVMALPEHAESRDMLFVQMGRGINLCALSNGKIISGGSSLAGEIGHIQINGNDRLCECGNRGCLETLISGDALSTAASKGLREHPEQYPILAAKVPKEKIPKVRTICAAADAGDEGCAGILETAGTALGETLAAAVMLLNPDKLILAGRPTEALCFREAVDRALSCHCLSESRRNLRLCFMGADRAMDAEGAARLPYLSEFDPTEAVLPF